MGLRSLLRNLTKLVLLVLGGLLGALVVVLARANDEWTSLQVPSEMLPGSDQTLEYEAKVWAIVGLSFAAGALSCFWFALAVWIRAVQRERRLARSLERLESQVAAKSGRRLSASEAPPALPEGRVDEASGVFDDFEELEPEGVEGELLADEGGLPIGYDEEIDESADDHELLVRSVSGREGRRSG